MKKIYAIAVFLLLSGSAIAQNPVGIFGNHTDVGLVVRAGSANYDEPTQTYKLSASGSNIWFKKDEMHYAWQKLKGDFMVQAEVSLEGVGTDPHRKLGLMFRSGLDTNATMVSVTVHGDGLAAFQYRKIKDTNIEEVKAPIEKPDVVKLERRGSRYIVSLARFGDIFWTVEVPDIHLGPELYVGLFVCSHNKDVVETGSFRNVRITVPAPASLVPYKEYLGSRLETMDIATGLRQVVYSENASMQAPNWTTDNKALIYNKDGSLFSYDLTTAKVAEIFTDTVKNNNNDHVLSFDGKMLGLSSSSNGNSYGSRVYTMPASGGKPKLITPTGPSYLHGWSPDGKWLTFTGQRNNEFDIYKVPATGGPEVRLTNAKGLDDGSEYSPDGKYIYFNSTRSGTMQLWRMNPNGQNQEQLTDDEFNNWFPHISPDGKTIVFISYTQEVKPDQHPFYKHVYLRTMPVGGHKPRVIAYLYGGQGSINTPSWSPDSKKIAFVSNSKM
jgi:Tol biopolymer transport system component